MQRATLTVADKKRKINRDDDASNRGDGKNSNINNDAPLVFLNVGGAKRNVRRSLLNDLRDASRITTTTTARSSEGGSVSVSVSGEVGTSTNVGISNPLCDVLLRGAEHWSAVPTTTDADNGTVRIYLDRNPQAFDDLLEYIEYRKLFIKDIIDKDGGANGARLERLRLECGYFTVFDLSVDIDEVMFGDPVSFRSNGWFTIAGQVTPGGWRWENVSGNQSIASRHTSHALPICEVKRTGTYLVFFSLHTVAVTALAPNEGYYSEGDEFINLGVFHEKMTMSECGHHTYPLLRCGAFDYRTDDETRLDTPLVITAACAEPISLRKGNQLYCEHGTGIIIAPGRRVGGLVDEHSELDDDPHSVNYITLVQVFGDNIAKWNIQREIDPKAEPTIATWMTGNNDFPIPMGTSPPNASIDDKDETKIRFKKAGYYLLLGRVAARLRKGYSNEWGQYPAIQLELSTNGGIPLHIIPQVVSYPRSDEENPYNNKIVDYGPINDILYAEQDSYVCVKAMRGACFARHGSGSVPDSSFGRIPAQSLSAMRLEPSARVDRYHVSLHDNGQTCFKRALGGDEQALEQQLPLFTIKSGMREENILKAVMDCQCIVVGSISSHIGNEATLLKNGESIVHSQLCKDSGRGSHSFHGIIDLKENDRIQLTYYTNSDCRDDNDQTSGHLAFVVLES